MTIKNPFVLNGYAGAEYFCDREKETSDLIRLVENGNNVVLTSHRRVGKTDLIQHLFAQSAVKDQFIPIYVDAYPTRNLSEFISVLGRAVTEALKPRGKKAVDAFIGMLTSLRSEITFDANGMPSWGLGIGKGVTPEVTLDEIFRYLNSSDVPCLVAIDEFQQVTTFPKGSQVEALLRSYVQQSPYTRFIFSGSERHLMAEMFTSASRPFFQSATLYGLPLLPKEVYARFCKKLFERGMKQTDTDVVSKVYDLFGGVTLYMHKVMNQLYDATPAQGTAQAEDINMAVQRILDRSNDAYTAIFYQLSERQRALILAMAKEGEAREIGSQKFIQTHNLPPQSTLSGVVKQLLDRDLITRENQVYTIYDRFFSLWVRNKILHLPVELCGEGEKGQGVGGG
ncbi:MAG: ATP-binding protein [Bacteroidales bacterium]|nr:ATP-binding protein [Bacteroidales bacterium]